jgi:hypothetical protein
MGNNKEQKVSKKTSFMESVPTQVEIKVINPQFKTEKKLNLPTIIIHTTP